MKSVAWDRWKIGKAVETAVKAVETTTGFLIRKAVWTAKKAVALDRWSGKAAETAEAPEKGPLIWVIWLI